MFGIGGTELLVIFIVALLVLGPQSLPKIAKSLGKALGEFRRVSTEFQRTLNDEAAEEEKNLSQRNSAQTPAAGAEEKDHSGKGHSA
ncbi:MAG: twin-arginine translocase subunit TatB [Desulfovibrionaceae bacterium]|nr:twin-arginine translocase subunit TatB [Desulfovibrionaceae bacterium]